MKHKVTIPGTSREYDAEENADGDLEVIDEHGARWTRNTWTSADGMQGETYGKNHPNPPLLVKQLRTKERERGR